MRGAARTRAAARAAVARALVRLLDRPVSEHYGFDRGRPVDRVYIEGFLQRHAADVQGRVLEVKDDAYARALGGSRVQHVEVVDVDAGNGRATLIADLDEPGSLPADAYDCVLLTQVLEFLRPQTALPQLYRALRPGGVLLLSVPCLCRAETPDSDLWRLTGPGLGRLLADALPADAEVHVEAAGNLAAAVGFLTGLSVDEVGEQRLEPPDWRFPVVALARVRRPAA